jgi:hypothetical protein
MTELISGWLFDVYPNETNLTLWIIAEDGQRLRFFQDFTVTIYAAGPSSRLRDLWKWLETQDVPVRLSRTERKDVFQVPQLVTVLAVEVLQPAGLDGLFRKMVEAFPDLTYYDADISLPLRHAAAFNVFPLARCRFEVHADRLLSLLPLDTPWELEPEPAPLRILSLEPAQGDPAHAKPGAIQVAYEHVQYLLPLDPTAPLLACLAAELNRYDPDVILTSWGDTWLLPSLLEICRENGSRLPLNRDETQAVLQLFVWADRLPRPAGAAARPLAPRSSQRHALERLRPAGCPGNGPRHPPAGPGRRPAVSGNRHFLHAVRHRPAKRHPHPLAQTAG